MNFQHLFPSLLILIVAILFTACQKDEDDDNSTNPTPDSIDAVIMDGGSGAFHTRDSMQSEVMTEETFIDGEEWICESYTVSLEDGIGANDNGFSTFNPNASVVYPGNLLQGATLADATPSIIPVARSGGSISINIIDGNGQSNVPVDEVTKGKIQEAANTIIDSTKEVPANFVLSARQVHSNEQLAIEMGMSMQKFNSKFAADFNLNSSSNSSNFMVRLDQIFYTLSFDIPTSYDGFFAPEVTAEDLKPFVGQGNPATFISDVSYGRVYYMLITCTSSQFNIGAGISGSFNGGLVGGSGSVNVDYLSSLEDVNITVKAYGGDAVETLRNFNNTNMDEIAEMLANTTKIGTGLPISYVVRSVLDKQIVSVKSATTYDVTNCLPATLVRPPATTAHWDGVMELLGSNVGAAANIGAPFERKIAFFDTEGTQYVLSDNTNTLSGPFPLNDLMPAGVEFPLANVGAAGRYLEAGAYRGTYFFDKTGLNFFYLSKDGAVNTNLNFQGWAGGDYPLADEGIGAFCQGTTTNASDTRFVAFNNNGDQYVFYNTGGDYWQGVTDLACWGISIGCLDDNPRPIPKTPFNTVGAATFYQIADIENMVLINKEGTKYTIWDNEEGKFSYPFSF